jgi:acrylyl-CoA reductase (NADPH)
MSVDVEPFPCLMVRRQERGEIVAAVEEITVDQLPPGEVLIQVGCSSLNYKDALAVKGNPGVSGPLPNVPGVDCSGRVQASDDPDFCPSDPVIVTGYGLGSEQWGGFSQYVRVPSAWVVRRPPGWNASDAMVFGTAGFCAAQAVAALQRHDVTPDAGPIAVTGASGAVGSLAVAILAKLGYEVSAVTGKPRFGDVLMKLGAKEILPRDAIANPQGKPLLSARWAGAVDVVGGEMLSALLASTKYRGCVAACGLTGSDAFTSALHPFLLRGVTLFGVDSAKCPRDYRLEIWRLLGGPWRPANLDLLTREITLSEVPAAAEEMLAGKSQGRVLIRPRT